MSYLDWFDNVGSTVEFTDESGVGDGNLVPLEGFVSLSPERQRQRTPKTNLFRQISSVVTETTVYRGRIDMVLRFGPTLRFFLEAFGSPTGSLPSLSYNPFPRYRKKFSLHSKRGSQWTKYSGCMVDAISFDVPARGQVRMTVSFVATDETTGTAKTATVSDAGRRAVTGLDCSVSWNGDSHGFTRAKLDLVKTQSPIGKRSGKYSDFSLAGFSASGGVSFLADAPADKIQDILDDDSASISFLFKDPGDPTSVLSFPLSCAVDGSFSSDASDPSAEAAFIAYGNLAYSLTDNGS